MESYLMVPSDLNYLIFHFLLAFLINLHFLQSHIAHFDIIIVLSFLVLKASGFMFSVFHFAL